MTNKRKTGARTLSGSLEVICRHQAVKDSHYSLGALPLGRSTRKLSGWMRADRVRSPPFLRREPVISAEGRRRPATMAISTFQKLTLATCLVLCVALLLPKMLLSRGRKDAAERPEGASSISARIRSHVHRDNFMFGVLLVGY